MRALALALLALLLPGCQGPTVVHERALTLPGGGYAEVNLLMLANETIAWTWQADARLAFDVHSHHHGHVLVHLASNKTVDEGSFTAPATGGYSLLWDNLASQPSSLHYKVTGQARLDPGHPPVPP